MELPSRFKINERVNLLFNKALTIGYVAAVKHTQSGILYDIEIDLPKEGTTIIKDIQSELLKESEI